MKPEPSVHRPTEKLDRKLQILIIGYGNDVCTPEAIELAYRAGRRVAEKGAVLVTGGLGGVMEAAAKGAYDAGGVSVGIIPYDEKSKGNPFNSIVICTGMGYARNFITAYSADAVVVIGGGSGTLSEMAAAYIKRVPIIAVAESGGVASLYAGKTLDERNLVVVEAVVGPEDAVDRAVSVASSKVGASSS